MSKTPASAKHWARVPVAWVVREALRNEKQLAVWPLWGWSISGTGNSKCAVGTDSVAEQSKPRRQGTSNFKTQCFSSRVHFFFVRQHFQLYGPRGLCCSPPPPQPCPCHTKGAIL